MSRNTAFPVSRLVSPPVLRSRPLTRGATLFCDFDGPIADVSDRYYSTYQQALAKTQAHYAAQGITLPVRLLTKTQFWEMKQTRVPDKTIADWSGLDRHQADVFLEQVNGIVNHPTLLSQDRLQPGTREALAALHCQGIRVIIVTLRQSAQVMRFLYDHDLTSMVQQIYGANDATTAYPNRVEHKIASLKAAIADQQRLGWYLHDCWMIGDTEADIGAGQAAQIPTIGLSCGIRSAGYLADFHPTRLYGSLYEATEFLLTMPEAAIAC
jgi:phosphoglycolate phosphatase